MGRNKIKIKKINCPIKRRETFRKRSKGILKKVKELAILCGVEVGVTMLSSAGKSEHFSNGPRTEQLLQQVKQNFIPNMLEDVMTNLQATENAHVPIPVQYMQVENEPGTCADYRDELNFGCNETELWAAQQAQMQRPASMQAFVPGQFRPDAEGQFGDSDDMWRTLVGGPDMPSSDSVQQLHVGNTSQEPILLD